MVFESTSIPEVVLCKPKAFHDDRGYFMETFREDLLFDFLGYTVNFCQDNESRSDFGVLRGLHYQKPPYAQSKLVRVIQGSVLDVAVDMRKGSPYFGKSVAVPLSESNKHQLFVPRGFAHGFAVLSEQAIFAYKCDNFYNPSCEAGVAYNDPYFEIDWLLSSDQVLLSDKDASLPGFKNASYFDYNQNLYSL